MTASKQDDRIYRGRVPADGVRDTKRINVTLDQDSANILRALGDGDLSAGIRKAAKLLSHAATPANTF